MGGLLKMSEKKYKISQIFYSMQGEGRYTGLPCVFVRFFGCNLQCNFGGETELPEINSLDEFVVNKRGCDSGYAWMKGMEKFTEELTVKEISEKIISLFPKVEYGEFGIVYTGGEPLLHQDGIYEISRAIEKSSFSFINYVIHIIETNGTIVPNENLIGNEFHFSISPKLFSVTNQKNGILIDSLRKIISLIDDEVSSYILKFVLDNNEESWKELENVLEELERPEFLFDRSLVYIMPVGSTKTQQESKESQEVVIKALSLGYKISGRMHVHLFNNEIAR